MMHDVLVVGAGLAGLMAVNELDKAGVDYVCYEKQKEYSINCGEGISVRNLEKLKLDVDVVNVTDKIKVRVGKKNFSIDKKIAHIDRKKLQQKLAKGKNIKFGVSIKDIKVKENVVVKTSKGIIKAKKCIVAGGSSFIKSKSYNSYGYVVNASFDSILFDPLDKFGLFWIFPKGKTSTVGVSYIGYGLDMKKELDKYMNKYFDEYQVIRKIGGVTPVGGPRKSSEKLLYCGDAGGFVGAALGDGIYYALESGRLAGLSIVNDADYNKMWKKSIGSKLRKSLLVKKVAYGLYKTGLIDLFENQLFNYYKKKVLK